MPYDRQMEIKRKDDMDIGFRGLSRMGSKGVGGSVSDGPPAVPLPHYARVGETGYALLLVPSDNVLSITKSKVKVSK